MSCFTRFLAVCMVFSVYSAYAQDIQLSIQDGGSIIVPRESTYVDDLNEGSSLRRSWIVMDNLNCPLTILDAGVSLENRPRSVAFRATGRVKARTAVSAFEVKFFLFDVFGKVMRILSYDVIKDIDSGAEVPLTGDWSASYSDANLHTVVAFVAQVRTMDDSVWRSDDEEIASSIAQLGLTPNPTFTLGNEATDE